MPTRALRNLLKYQVTGADSIGMSGVASSSSTRGSDSGFTLVEILIVIVLVGVLSAAVVFAVRGVRDRGEVAACGADARVIATAAEVYLAEEAATTIPPTGTGGDRFEQTLVDAELLKEVSVSHDLAANGTVTASGVPCT
jgi:general secretion pathway protein G